MPSSSPCLPGANASNLFPKPDRLFIVGCHYFLLNRKELWSYRTRAGRVGGAWATRLPIAHPIQPRRAQYALFWRFRILSSR